jgi:hypothetical protein
MHLVRCGRCLPLLVVVALVALVATPGCTRQHFRKRADKDVEGIITQKNISPDWEVKNWHVYPDPRSRFADNSNPDRPPYPPDDPAARLLSPNPQRPTKKSGVGRIDGTGYVGILEQWDARNRATADAQAYGPAPETEPFQALPTQEAGNSINSPVPGVSTGVVNKFSSHAPPVVPVESRGTVNKFGPPIPIENASCPCRKCPHDPRLVNSDAEPRPHSPKRLRQSLRVTDSGRPFVKCARQYCSWLGKWKRMAKLILQLRYCP